MGLGGELGTRRDAGGLRGWDDIFGEGARGCASKVTACGVLMGMDWGVCLRYGMAYCEEG